ncbi:MAG: hypothetical protein IH962_05075 [Chloroflexi bacterium]|nr:hypothetical protein [Chloroflexota bacterium]
MLETDRVAAVFQDAWVLYADALEELGRDKIRNAAEKAWGATKRATDALILARTGEEPPTTALTSQGLRALASEASEVESLVGRYYTRIGFLHGECFYNGMCHPVEDTERRIRETDNYIRDAQGLASDR